MSEGVGFQKGILRLQVGLCHRVKPYKDADPRVYILELRQ